MVPYVKMVDIRGTGDGAKLLDEPRCSSETTLSEILFLSDTRSSDLYLDFRLSASGAMGLDFLYQFHTLLSDLA